jgi:hypothetical protein
LFLELKAREAELERERRHKEPYNFQGEIGIFIMGEWKIWGKCIISFSSKGKDIP